MFHDIVIPWRPSISIVASPNMSDFATLKAFYVNIYPSKGFSLADLKQVQLSLLGLCHPNL